MNLTDIKNLDDYTQWFNDIYNELSNFRVRMICNCMNNKYYRSLLVKDVDETITKIQKMMMIKCDNCNEESK